MLSSSAGRLDSAYIPDYIQLLPCDWLINEILDEYT